MRFTIWGSRGSYPTTLSPDAIRSKISTVIQRARPGDLASAESRERFLASLPAWLFGTVGGNTACVELEIDPDHRIIFDAGSGIIRLGASLSGLTRSPRRYDIFFTHFHYDHIQGLPFFGPAYDPKIEIHLYSPLTNLESTLVGQMEPPFFPVRMKERMANVHVHQVNPGGIELFGARIRPRELNHPGRAFGYRVDHDGRSFGYMTDVELQEEDFLQSPENESLFEGLHALILDTQYTLGESIEKFNWGHSSYSLGVDFAVAWSARRLYLFHHEPLYDDRTLYRNLRSARWYASRLGGHDLTIDIAREGLSADV